MGIKHSAIFGCGHVVFLRCPGHIVTLQVSSLVYSSLPTAVRTIGEPPKAARSPEELHLLYSMIALRCGCCQIGSRPGFLKSRRMCSLPHPKEKKERDAAGGRPPRHALSFLFLPPQAASLS